MNGGSAGVFTLVRDSSLEDLIVRAPLISTVTDMHIGHALDGTLRNAPPPFGCQAGGGNVCALDGLKVIASVQGNQPNTLAPAQVNQFGGLFTMVRTLGLIPQPLIYSVVQNVFNSASLGRQVGLLLMLVWDVLAIPLLLWVNFDKGHKEAGENNQEAELTITKSSGQAQQA